MTDKNLYSSMTRIVEYALTTTQLCNRKGQARPLRFSVRLRNAPSTLTTIALTMSDDSQGTLQPSTVVVDRYIGCNVVGSPKDRRAGV